MQKWPIMMTSNSFKKIFILMILKRSLNDDTKSLKRFLNDSTKRVLKNSLLMVLKKFQNNGTKTG